MNINTFKKATKAEIIVISVLTFLLFIRYSSVTKALFPNNSSIQLLSNIVERVYLLVPIVVLGVVLYWFLARLEGPKFFYGVLALSILVVVFSKWKLPLATDEKRDYEVANVLIEKGMDTYLDRGGLEVHALSWSQYLHPPLQYALLSTVSGGNPRSATSHRLRYSFYVVLSAFVLLLIGRLWLRLNYFDLSMLIAIVLSFTYYRNYVLVRVYNEFLPSVTMMVTALYCVKSIKSQRIPYAWTPLLGLFLFLGLCSKFTILLAYSSLIGALVLLGLLLGKRTLLYLALLFSVLTIAGLLAYALTFNGTEMLQRQADFYSTLILNRLGMVTDAADSSTSYLQEYTKKRFLLGFYYWFGPFIIGAFIFLLIKWVTSYKEVMTRMKQKDSALMKHLFLLAGLVHLLQVLLVMPRAVYLSPSLYAFTGVAYLFYKDAAPELKTRLAAGIFAYVFTETLLVIVGNSFG